MKDIEKESIIEKVIALTKESIRIKKDSVAIAILENSSINYDKIYNTKPLYQTCDVNILIKVIPGVYSKNLEEISRVERLIERSFIMNSPDSIRLSSVDIKPDYDKVAILNSQIEIVITEWDSINERQKKLIDCRKTSNDSMDYQNIGLVARSLMEDLADKVFNGNIHIAPLGLAVTKDKYKNRLHTYIKHKLEGKSNDEYRKFVESSIEFTEKGIDLMNTTTHKLSAKMHFADACLLCAINVVSLIKSMYDNPE